MDQEEHAVPPHFVTDLGSGRLRLTSAGAKAYARRFALAGIPLQSITTRKRLLKALNDSTTEFLDEAVEMLDSMEGDPKAKALLADILLGRKKP